MPVLHDSEPVYPDAVRPTVYQDGLEYQDWLRPRLACIGIAPQYNTSRKGQLSDGESWQGIEIKLDQRCSDTGRVSIEVAEKARASNEQWIPSGICRPDNTVIYVQGNYQIVFCFGRKHLLDIYHQKHDFHESHGTVRKFYLSISRAAYVAFAVLVDRNSSLGRQGRLQFTGSTKELFGWDGGERQIVTCRPHGELLVLDVLHSVQS